MLRLPNELLLIIVSLLDTDTLLSFTQVCSRLRHIAIFPFLAHYAITQDDLGSGMLHLRTSRFSIIVVFSHLSPIEKLVVFTPLRGEGLKRLAATLRAVSPIPDIVFPLCIFGPGLTPSRDFATFVSTIFSEQRLAVLGRGTLDVPRPAPSFPPFPLAHFLVGILNVGAAMHISFFSLIPLALHPQASPLTSIARPRLVEWLAGFALLVVGATFIASSASSICRRARLGKTDRLAVELTHHFNSPPSRRIRLQRVPAPFVDPPTKRRRRRDIALCTSEDGLCDSLVLSQPPSPLTAPEYRMLLRSLDLRRSLRQLSVGPGCALTFDDITRFLSRHNVTDLRFDSHSLAPSDIAPALRLPICLRITDLTAPAPYIPALMPLLPSLRNICIDCSDSSEHVFDAALGALARLSGPADLSLALDFHGASTRTRTGNLALVLHSLNMLNKRPRPWHAHASSVQPVGLVLPRVVRLALIEAAPSHVFRPPRQWHSLSFTKAHARKTTAADCMPLAFWLTHTVPALRELVLHQRPPFEDLGHAQLGVALQHARGGEAPDNAQRIRIVNAQISSAASFGWNFVW